MPVIEKSGGETAEKTRDTARRTLAMRIAHRNRLRAERLARLHQGPDAVQEEAAPGMTEEAPVPAQDTAPVAEAPQEEPAPSAPEASAPPADISTLPRKDEGAEAEADSSAALEEFLRALNGGASNSVLAIEPEPSAVLQFQRPEAAPASEPLAAPVCDLGRLVGIGPGLIWALQRAGINCLADLSGITPETLKEKLGPLGRLIPAAAWIAAAAAEAEMVETRPGA